MMQAWFYFSAIGFSLLVSNVAAAQQEWEFASATYYGDMTGVETFEGACGYGNLFKLGYGLQTTGLSSALFNNGSTCGACYQIRCVDNPRNCTSSSITITATNYCAPNPAKPMYGWCNPPRKNFELSMPMFVKLVNDYHDVPVIAVAYRRVPCVKKGGVRFEIKGNPKVILVLVYNVGGAGDVTGVEVKGSGSGGWSPMSRSWGQNWETRLRLVGEGLSFRVTASDGRSVESVDLAPANWHFGQTFEGKQF